MSHFSRWSWRGRCLNASPPALPNGSRHRICNGWWACWCAFARAALQGLLISLAFPGRPGSAELVSCARDADAETVRSRRPLLLVLCSVRGTLTGHDAHAPTLDDDVSWSTKYPYSTFRTRVRIRTKLLLFSARWAGLSSTLCGACYNFVPALLREPVPSREADKEPQACTNMPGLFVPSSEALSTLESIVRCSSPGWHLVHPTRTRPKLEEQASKQNPHADPPGRLSLWRVLRTCDALPCPS